MAAPKAGRYELDLRVDIDVRHANSPVMDKLSGDIYQVFTFRWGRRIFRWKVYRESWIVQSPQVTWHRCSVTITGKVHYWKGGHPTTNIEVEIPWATFHAAGPAKVTFTEVGGSTFSYSCDRKSRAFREVTLEVDVCSSVNAEPILPSYDTGAHSNRPADLPQRTLAIEEAYMEAGIDLTIDPARTIIDDSASKFSSWSPAELHDAMETHFSQISSGWPKWHMWGLLAGTFDSPSVGGIMFDAAAGYGGAGEAPERQGCAVFRKHTWFADLAAPPTNDTEAAAMRKLLYTYVHEIGHAFNFLHSWNKGRPDALSWMNYDWRYDSRNGADSFWADFYMRFDDEELIHMRHGDRAAVIMGGDPWASGGHLEAPPGAMSEALGTAPVELLLRSKGFFDFLEPVSVELRLRNLSGLPMELDTQLNPEFGGVTIYIRRPDGRILEYAPILCKLGTPEVKLLKALPDAVEGEDRYSQEVPLSYGTYGFYFDQPGEYQVRAVYQGAGELLVTSNRLRLRVGNPLSRDEDRLAQDFFTYQTGMALYLDGSSSPWLDKGMNTLQEVVDRYGDTPVGAKVALALARNLSKPFYRVDVDRKKLVKYRDAKPDEAMALTAQAVEQQTRDETTFTNIEYRELREVRIDLYAGMGESAEADEEKKTLAKDLKDKVNKPVLADIKAREPGA